jgi:chemotaxis protein methyltransferase CheR
MMHSSISDRSSLFLLRGAQPAADAAGDYILEATRATSGAPELSSSLFELGVVPRRGAQHPLAAAVNQALAPQESRFFGEVGCLASIITHVLPTLLPRRRYAQNLRLWSAGCATGQQTYSLAVALAELCPGLANWNLEIVASDADAWTLARARQGIYTSSEVQRGLPTEWLVRHFEQLPGGRAWRISPRLAVRMRWLQLDLSQSCSSVSVADIVVCHRKLGEREIGLPARRQLLARLTDQLASDGFLVLQSPDATLERGFGLELVYEGGPAVYRRIERDVSLLSA